MTLRTENVVLLPTDFLEMSPDDAARLGVRTGDSVRIVSRYGEAVLPARVEPIVKRGQLFTTFHDPKVFTNRVTSSFRDRTTSTPEYKVTAVRVEKA
jgi:formate dehydrogenase major subunit